MAKKVYFLPYCAAMWRSLASLYQEHVKAGKEIDTLFREYVMKRGLLAFNFKPCMVEHIDNLIGGSIANPERITVKAVVFDDPEAVERVRRWSR